MTDTNDKIRGLVLAALMVFSVFAGTVAFAGTAAAVDNVNHDSNGYPATVAEGSSHTEDFTVNVTNVSASDQDVTVDVSVTNASFTSINNVKVTGESGSATVSSSGQVTNGNLTVKVKTDTANDNLTVTFEAATVEFDNVNSDSTAQFSATVSDSGDGSTASSDIFTADINDQSTSGDSVQIEGSSIVYQGQTVKAIGFNGSETVNLRKGTPGDSTWVNSFDANSNGNVSIQTGDLEIGQDYFLKGENTNGNASFEVVNHKVSLSVGSNELNNAGSDTTTDFSFSSNRQSFDVYVMSSGLSAAEIEGAVGDDLSTTQVDLNADGTPESVMVSVDRNTDYTLNATGLDAGSYTFTFDVTDTTSSVSTDVNVSDVGAGSAEFDTNTQDVSQGDVASIDISLSGAATGGTLIIGDESSEGYQANVSFTDDGDGAVTIKFNTYTAGDTTEDVVWAAGDDAVTSSDQTPISAILAQGDYTLSVSTSTDASTTKDQPQDLGALVIGERSTDSHDLWTAPADATFDADANGAVTESEITTLIEDDMVSSANGAVTKDDYAVHEISATGLEGVIESEGNLSAALSADDTLSLSIVQTNPVQNQDPKAVNISQSGNALTLVEGDGAYYIVVDMSLVTWDEGSGVENGDEFKATFTVADNSLVGSTKVAAHESVSTTFTVEGATTSLDSDPVSVEAGEEQMISGSTNYAPGTELTVRVRSSDDVSPGFFNTQDVTVQADGTFNASFDFSDQAAGDTFSVTVRKSGTTQVSADGQIVGSTTPTPTPTDEPTDTPTDEPTDTPTDEPTDTPTDEPTATPTDEPTDEPDTATTTTETPGFGVVVALVALLAAAMLAGRRE